jgi:hypothetical protein
MDKQEVLIKIGNLLDRTNMGHVVWQEGPISVYSNKTNKAELYSDGIRLDGEVIYLTDFPDLLGRLYKSVQKLVSKAKS